MSFPAYARSSTVVVVMTGVGLVHGLAGPFQLAEARPEFEAASIKIDSDPLMPGTVGIRGGPGTADPGRFTASGVTLSVLICQAYGVAGDLLSGQTRDIREERFKVTATFPPTTSKELFRVMLQNLLADRFHLAVHRERRELPGYELTIAAGGVRFREWKRDPNAPPRISGQPLQEGQSGFNWLLKRQPPMMHVTNRQSVQDFVEQLPLLWRMSENMRGDADRDERIRAFRNHLGPAEPNPLFVDRTGLVGQYEFSLEFEGAMGLGRSSAGGPTLTEALEKQLGLKLARVKHVPVDMIIIDHVDRYPEDN